MAAISHLSIQAKRRKFLLVLPLLVLPFLFFLFFVLGGGKGATSHAQNTSGQKGINTKLPDAHFKKGKEKDKLGFYEQSNTDSAKRKEAIKNDPVYNTQLQTIGAETESQFNQHGLSTTSRLPASGLDNKETKLLQKLEQLKEKLNNNTEQTEPKYSPNNQRQPNPDLERLQNLMGSPKQNKRSDADPELDHIDGMLDKIMHIQHPEQLEDSLKRLSQKNKRESFAVSLTDNADSSEQTGFYGLSDQEKETGQANAIEACIQETQTLVSGAVVKLRLLQTVYIHGIPVFRDQLIYGISTLSNERLKIAISTIRSNDNILPVALEVYDMDGLQGIYIPGSINRDVSKESADEAIGSVGLSNLDPSLGAQAANAGIQAAKTLLSKKIKLIRVNVKAGYKVLLRDNSRK
jgi:conjugative transposon TraM protein